MEKNVKRLFVNGKYTNAPRPPLSWEELKLERRWDVVTTPGFSDVLKIICDEKDKEYDKLYKKYKKINVYWNLSLYKA